MAITLVDKVEIRSSATNNPSATLTTPPATGDAVVVNCGGFDSTAAFTSVTDTKSNTYTRRGTSTNQTNYRGDAFSAHNITGGATFTITVNKTEADSNASWVSAWTGVSTSATPSGTSTTGASTAPAITSGTLAGESVVVAHAGYGLGGTETTITQPSSPWVFIGEEEDFALYVDNNTVSQVASSGTLTSTWTLAVSKSWFTHQVTVEGSGGISANFIYRARQGRPFPWRPGSARPR